jgi:hypothetical protein
VIELELLDPCEDDEPPSLVEKGCRGETKIVLVISSSGEEEEEEEEVGLVVVVVCCC